MAVATLIDVILRDGGSLTTGKMVVQSESSNANPATVRDASKTLGDIIITNHMARAEFRNVPMVQSTEC